MITHVSIKNFRSFGVSPAARPHEFALSPLTIIVGDNSSGKSNILRALQFATDPFIDDLCRSDFFISKGKDRERRHGKIEIVLKSTMNGMTHTIRCVAEGTDRKGYSKTLTINNKKYPTVTKLAPPKDDLGNALRPHQVFIAPTIRDAAYLRSATDLMPLATRSTIAGISNKLRDELTKKLAKICKQLESPLGVQGVSVAPLLNLDELMRIVELGFEVSDQIFLPLQNLGQGLISKAILKLAEIQGAKHSICIEEPEIHVHPTGIKTLIETFRKVTANGHRQIIVTTHSQSVVNSASFDSLLVVQKSGQRSVVNRIDPNRVGYVGTPGQQVENVLLRKSQRGDLFLSKIVLLVEGPYDRMVIELLDRNGRIGLLRRDVVIVEIGGLGEFGKYHKLLLELDRPHAALVDNGAIAEPASGGTSSATVGTVIKLLVANGVLRSSDWTTSNAISYMKAKSAQARRSMVKKLSLAIAKSRVRICTHGHHDMKDAIGECIAAISSAEKLQVYRALGGQKPNPPLAEIKSRISSAVAKKSFEMLQVVAALPEKRFEKITRQIVTALEQIK